MTFVLKIVACLVQEKHVAQFNFVQLSVSGLSKMDCRPSNEVSFKDFDKS